MKIVRVFTKYDVPFLKINVPTFRNLEAKDISECSFPEVADMDIIELMLESVEAGLEDVIFIQYSEEGKIKNIHRLINAIGAARYRKKWKLLKKMMRRCPIGQGG